MAFFLDHKDKFLEHDITHGVEYAEVTETYRSDDYRNLFNLVTHGDRRSAYDIVTKHIIAGVLVVTLQAAGYFATSNHEETTATAANPEADVLIGKTFCRRRSVLGSTLVNGD